MQLPHEWRARPYQIPLWRYLRYEDGKRAIAIWHRRAGKDEVALHWAAVAQKLKVANYWHMLPEYAQARKAIWNAVNPHSGRRRIDEAFPQALRKATNEQEMFIRFRNGSTWQVVGSDSYNKLIGTPPYGVVVSEWATADPAAWAYLAPILAENGGWAVFITTPRGRNHACKMYEMARDDPQWFADLATYRDTGALSDAQVEAQRREYRSIFGDVPGDALIEQEYLCSFDAAVLGAYWASELAAAEREGRVRELDADPALPVHTVWDLGIGDSTAIFWWQASGDEVRILDHHEAHGQGLAYYARLVHAKPWRRGDDHVPHDARARELGTGRTRIETMRTLGLQPRLVPDHKLMDGINAARLVIPKCFFDAARCRTALELLRQYRAAYDDKARVFGATPKHDFTSHTADAFRYLAMAWRELAAEPPPGRSAAASAR
ncbi:MAG: hypothetical protein M3N38_08795 [Pseudomonadota bacterium]|nr:hypothetical protein [Pseudomonadota bacterium]